MENKVIFLDIAICVAIMAAVGYGYYYFNYERGNEGEMEGERIGNVTLTALTYENLPRELSRNSMVRAIPEDGTISLRFYNFDTGERQWERNYTLRRGNVTEMEASEADIYLSLHSSYLEGLTNLNFCDVIQRANQNGDLGFETNSSRAALLWKFKRMMDYRSCFGL